MRTFILLCYFLGVSFAIECYLGGVTDDHPINQMAVNCTEGCKYCAKASVKIKSPKRGIAVWGCGCEGGDYDILKALQTCRDVSRAFGKTCTKTGTKHVETDRGEAELYCCDTDNCIST